MINHFWLFGLLFLCFSATGQETNRENIYGKVKSIKITKYYFKENFGNPKKGATYPFGDNPMEILFDKKGKITQKNIFYSDNTLKYIEKYTYENEKLVFFDKFDFRNRLIKKCKYEYNEKQQLALLTEYGKDGNTKRKFVYLYDEQERLSERKEYDENQKIFLRQTYHYENGFLDKICVYNAYYNENNLSSCDNYVYKEGKLFEINHINANNYIENHQKYDEKGNLIQKDEYLYEYTFDKKGNWIQKIEKDSNKTTFITERIIEYF